MAKSILIVVSAFCILVGASAVPASQRRLEIADATFYSLLDGKVITTTDYLEDPGPYDVYGSIAQTDEQLPEQRWNLDIYEGPVLTTMHVHPNGGQPHNSFSTYKPCPDCFSTYENWMIFDLGNPLNSQNPKLNTTALLKSTWTDFCLINPGNDYLRKGPCNESDTRQVWNIVWA